MTIMEETKGRQQATRDALIASAMRLFGRNGFDGTSIRAIAADAGTNSASIAYHFGGKEGLRRACAETIASRLAAQLEPVLASAGRDPDPRTAGRILEQLAATMAHFILVRPEAEDIAPFMLREVAVAGDVLDIMLTTVIGPLHRRVCAMWAAATGQDAESDDSRLTVFSVIGQVLYFRIGREIVVDRMGWQRIGAAEADMIVAVITRNVRAIIAAERGEA